MKKVLYLMAATLMLAACASTTSPISNVVDVTSLDFSDVQNIKTAQSCRHFILFIPFGERDIFAATKKGGLKQVKYVEYSNTSFIVYGKSCLKVYGH
ncbi:hypothetical protein Emin_1008 [Elusimicrobium minutum Pei191]|uniref:Lipoprotein n=1 Tax=Elusimicrobium minutum (strain Pei191) TaxID=445932 RepID=B2KDG5_ELUMP|nr:TRL domain-containing protein [Elusimicrobium minutum]ACC98561.1 hypothetical protein Emin_1008 [Elusimicrobium minutum Pei191]